MTILYVESNGTRRHYRMNVEADLDALQRDFPQVGHEIALATDVREAADIAAEYLDSHNMDAWVEDQEIVKGGRDKLLAASLAVLTAAPLPGAIPEMQQPPQQVQLAEARPRPAFGKKAEDRFLWTIAKIESNDGKNVEHQEVTKGPQKGQKAIGRWGMLPGTVADFVRREVAGGQHVSEPVLGLLAKSRDEIESQFSSCPDDELEVARMIARFVLRKHGWDERRAAYSWLHGTHLPSSAISDEQLAKSDYVDRYEVISSRAPSSFKERVRKWEGKHRKEERAATPSNHPSFSPVPATPPEPKGPARVVMALRAEQERRRRKKERS